MKNCNRLAYKKVYKILFDMHFLLNRFCKRLILKWNKKKKLEQNVPICKTVTFCAIRIAIYK